MTVVNGNDISLMDALFLRWLDELQKNVRELPTQKRLDVLRAVEDCIPGNPHRKDSPPKLDNIAKQMRAMRERKGDAQWANDTTGVGAGEKEVAVERDPATDKAQ